MIQDRLRGHERINRMWFWWSVALMAVGVGALCMGDAREKDLALPNGGTIRMVYVAEGEFLMGNNGGEPYCYPDELPQHRVYLSSYWIGKYEVTRGQYRRFIEAGGYDRPQYWSKEGWAWKSNRKQPGMWDAKSVWGPPLEFTQTDDYPVVGVSYYEAEAFCAWAGLRLPTEAQWEKAARWDGKSARVFPWGDRWDASKCNNWYDKLYEGYQSAPVGSYPDGASPYGCMDMAGNQWEWVRDWYDPGYYSRTPRDGWVDPEGPATGKHRSLRGGSWYYFDYNTRCAYRGHFFSPGNWYYEYGFRVVTEEPKSTLRPKPKAARATQSRVHNPTPRKRSKLGADAYTGKDPIGGGTGYFRTVDRSKARFVVSGVEDLKSALKSASAGDVVYVEDNGRIDASAEKDKIAVPGGVTIAGNRGENGAAGPLIFTTNLDHYPVFTTGGPGVRLTGVRVQGPDMEIRATGDEQLHNAVGVVVSHPKAEFDNCEFFGWSAAAIQYGSAGQGGRVHHCYIHHNRRAGNGYGVYVHEAFVQIEANRFAENRHDIAGSGRAGSSYRACYNISEADEPFTSHAFDMHGNHNSRAPGEIVPHIAGDSIVIFNNTFRSNRPRICIAIRGEPRRDLIIHDNVYENAFVGADILEPCRKGVIYNDHFTVPAKRAYYILAEDGNIVNGKRVKAGEMTRLIRK